MNWLNRIFRRRLLYNDLSEELRQHLEEKTAQLQRQGMSRKDAEQAARRAFGNPTLLEQRSREVWQWPRLESILRDVTFSARLLRKSPGFTLIVVLLLGLGIGASTAVFSLVDTVLLKPLPYPDPARLLIPWNVPPPGVNVGGYEELPWDPLRFHAMQHQTATFEYLGAFQSGRFNLTGAGDPVLLEGLRVTWGFLPALGVPPVLGRIFTPEEDQPGHEREVLLSNSVWRNRFHSNPGIVGRAIDLNGSPYTVVGVMPPGFAFPRANEMPGDFDFPREAQIWVPAAFPAVTPRFTPSELAIIGRLRPGVSLQRAQADMDLFAAQMDRLTPQAKGWSRSRVTPLQRQVAGDSRRPMLLMLCAVGAVLLIVCFNVAGLLLTRSFTRQREFTLRAALGAGRARVLRQLLTESLLLAAMGGTVGVAIAIAGVWLVRAFGPSSIPRLQEVAPDLRVLAFTASIILLTGIACGLMPALSAARVNLLQSLREGGQRVGTGPSGPRLRSALVVSQIALAFALVVAGGLLVRSFYRLLASDGGFRPEHVLTFELSLPSSRYPGNPTISRFYQQALPLLRAIPGVRSAAITEAVPMGGAPEATIIRLPGRVVHSYSELPIANYTIVSPGFFHTLSTPIERGREFLDSDSASAPAVTVINRTMAQRFWPGQDPIGRQVIVPSQHAPMTIIGIVGDIKHSSPREIPGPEMFVPYTQDVWPSMSIMQVVIRAWSAPDSVIDGARSALRTLDPSLPLANITTLNALTGTTMAADRFSMLLLDCFGLLSLLLAAIGIYGVISFSVEQRTREIGIRLALGATPRNVFRTTLGHGMRFALLGIGLGILAAAGTGRLLSGLLYGVAATDPLTFISVALFLLGIAFLAGFIPARRAASIDPMQALRAE
ncbi:MAG TPA: ABC transporter permease [Silvibacterium sp.]|nr:ABC transporter permease [Silvibacterium sp.]